MDPIADADDGGVWITVAELAKRKGVSRQAAAKRVASLEAAGKIETRKRGRSRLVELAAYDRAVDEVGDAAKESAAETTRQPASPALRDHQAERAKYEARLKALDLAERERKLLPIDGEHGIEAAATRIGVALAKSFDGLARYADDIAAAVSKEGTTGARRVLKDIARSERQKIADMLAAIASVGEAAEQAGPIETLLPEE
ncbi:winged helix-turn-helix domain-containing protein [Oricola thermophila]|uniref:Winged helix-turn-helix transcriptional regulator n=1 Tax=Oricola thermophila TaxID=2742145 RepID=A0A6N1VIJ8_9HYPH|nr:winged helix-turn-helix domain-containing protein [Oricola thermophila]QKV20253.1 winged helix-turn-helix transcriptional regulator [Oricola thermophila]